MKPTATLASVTMHAALALFLGSLLDAAAEPKTPSAPNFDKRDHHRPPIAPAAAQSLKTLEARAPGVQISPGKLMGSPRFFRSMRGFLTGPNGEGRSVTHSTASAFHVDDPDRAVKAFLSEYRGLFGHGPEILVTTRKTREDVTTASGLRTTVWQQELGGIAVYGAYLRAGESKRGELVNVDCSLVANLAAAAGGAEPSISAARAVEVAAAGVGDRVGQTLVSKTAAQGVALRQEFSAAVLNEARAELTWLPMDGKTLRLCWDVIFTSKARGEMYRVLVDAKNGESLLRVCLTHYISDATYHVWANDSPSPCSPCHQTPQNGQPAVVGRTLVTIDALDTAASPEGWIPDGQSETLGNNVDAHTDFNADDVPDTPRPNGGGTRTFNFPVDLAQEPSTYSDAAVTDLFYWNNVIHDRLYQLGFTESAGNFQVNNFGNGGLGGDAVQADAQDGSGTNNANFSTPPDGSPGRMQMFLFDGPAPDRDGDFDHEIVIHEYVHGLSNRLVGGGSLISELQTIGMGEGWSDFYGLCLLAESGDDIHGNFAFGGYATFEFSGLDENYYYGIRRYPYSTDLTKNPLTFKDIDPNQADSHTGIPLSPVGGGSADEVHNQGEVWCSALWEVRANLVTTHGFATGNELVLQLVTDGMKLSPSNPNFLEARDAIIQADLVLTGGANADDIWAGFAKRGMGLSATSPDSSTTFGVVEAFDVPDDLSVAPLDGLSSIGDAGGPFAPAVKSYTIENVGTATLDWTTSNTHPWLTIAPASGSLAAGENVNVNVSLNPAADALPIGAYNDTVLFTNTTSGNQQSRMVSLAVGLEFLTEQFTGGADPNDTSGLSFEFVPSETVNGYTYTGRPTTLFPTDPAGGTSLNLSDDEYEELTLSGGETVEIFGTAFASFHVGSNGYITFGSGDTGFGESLADHFDLPRISALFDDLNPSSGGTVSWKQLADRVAVTWIDVPEYGSSNQNSFQIEMFFDGRIGITILDIAAPDGLIGLSRGDGIPSGFIETDFSDLSYPEIVVHNGPTSDDPELVDGQTEAVTVGTITGTPVDRDFTIFNNGTIDLTVSSITSPAGTIVFNAPAVAIAPTTFHTFQIHAVAANPEDISGDVTITNDDPNKNPFTFPILFLVFDPESDRDSDGIGDWPEFRMADLGFDYSTAQTELFSTLANNAHLAGFYTIGQLQGIILDTPVIVHDPASNRFMLTLGLKKSPDLTDGSFADFPFVEPDTFINAEGKIEFEFEAPEDAAFFIFGTE